MATVTIDAKHHRLQAFLAGKGFFDVRKPQTLELTAKETDRLLKAAERHDYADQIKVHGGKAKVQDRAKAEATKQEQQASKVIKEAEEAVKADAEEEAEDEEAEEEPEEASGETQDEPEEKETLKVPRRRRVP